MPDNEQDPLTDPGGYYDFGGYATPARGWDRVGDAIRAAQVQQAVKRGGQVNQTDEVQSEPQTEGETC